MNLIFLQKNELKFKYFLLGVILFLLLQPYLNAGFWFDDLPNHYMGMADRVPYWTATLDTIYAWIKLDARFLLGFIPVYAIFYFISTPLLYHFVTICLLLINVCLFLKILGMLKCNKNLIILVLLILFGLFQISIFSDPIASFGGLYPLLGSMLCLGFIGLIKWQKTFELKYLWFSSLVIFGSLFFYEINLIFYPIAFIIIFNFRKSITIRVPLLILIVPLCVYGMLIVFLRHFVPHIIYDGIQLGTMKLFFITYLKQLFSAFPGSYYFTLGIYDYSFHSMCKDFFQSYYGLFLFMGSIILMSLLGLSTKKIGRMPRSLYFFAGMVLLTVPIFMAISAKYQMVLSWGVGYLPVYYQYFGLALLITGGGSQN